jgi:hypothetical protein
MAVTPNTTFVSGAILTAAQQNNFPRGIMGYAISTANTSCGTSATDLTGMSITFTAVANRLYRATFSGFGQQSANGRNFLQFTDASNTVFDSSVIGLTGADANRYFLNTAVYLFTGTGSITRKMRASVDSGTINYLGVPADGRTYSFTIEDIGGI